MKIVITEETLKKLILNEAMADVKAAMDKANATYHKLNPNAIKREIVTGNAYNNDFSLRNLFNTYGNGQYSPADSYAPVNVGNLGNWNVGKSIQYILSHATGQSGNCAKHVEDAIAAGGLPRMSCGENGGDNYAHSLHTTGVLKKYGFNMVSSGVLEPNGNISGGLNPGDIIILETGKTNKNHAAMWTGNQWVSDFRQKNANVYGLRAQYWIYRYAGGKS